MYSSFQCFFVGIPLSAIVRTVKYPISYVSSIISLAYIITVTTSVPDNGNMQVLSFT